MNGSLLFAAPEDDNFHEVASKDPSWVETVWFPFWLPAQQLSCYLHLHFCANQKIYRGSISVWRGDNEELFIERFEEPMPGLAEFGNLTNLSLPNGIAIRGRKPQYTFEVSFDHPDCRFRFSFDGLMLPVMMSPDASPGMFQGHMNQAGKASGEFRLFDRIHAIDCYTVRDRSWGPRHAATAHRTGNCHATGQDTSFYIYITADNKGNECIINGHFLSGGQIARVTAGKRKIEWDGNVPKTVTLAAEDELGRTWEANGQCLNLRLTTSPPNLCVVLSLIKWKFRDEVLWGESHDVWSEEAWLAAEKKRIA